jgi:hypothetical protein
MKQGDYFIVTSGDFESCIGNINSVQGEEYYVELILPSGNTVCLFWHEKNIKQISEAEYTARLI